MKNSFVFVFFFHLIVCIMVSSSYFQFESILDDFLRSLELSKKITYDHPLKYINWFIPFITPVLLCFIRPLRFNLHQSLIYNLICLLLMTIVFYTVEFLALTNTTLNLKFLFIKIWPLQLIHTVILSIIYWTNLIALVSNFTKNDVLLIQSCHILTTIFGNLDLKLTFKSYYFTYEMATIGLLVIYFIFWRFEVEIKDDFKTRPLLNMRNHVFKKPIVLGSFFESFCIGSLLFLYLYPFFGLFLLSFVLAQHQNLAEEFNGRVGAIAYFPLLCGLTFSAFFLSTFAHFRIKKTIWGMFAKNMLFIYIWSLMFDLKLPYGLMDAVFFAAIILNFIVQTSTVIEDLRSQTREENETLSLHTFGILFSGVTLSWITLTLTLGLKIHFFGTAVLSDYQLYYLYASFLVGLFLCSFYHILRDEYLYYQPAPIRISEPVYV